MFDFNVGALWRTAFIGEIKSHALQDYPYLYMRLSSLVLSVVTIGKNY